MTDIAFKRKFVFTLILELKSTPFEGDLSAWEYFVNCFGNDTYKTMEDLLDSQAVQRIVNVIATARLLHENKTILYQNLQTADFFKELVKAHIDQIASVLNRTHSREILFAELQEAVTHIDADPFIELFRQYHDTYFSSPRRDQRAYIPGRDENRRLRRYDSLARLLSLSSIHSACTSVALFKGQLIIGANAPSQQEEAIVSHALTQRLARLKQMAHVLAINLTRQYGAEWRTVVTSESFRASVIDEAQQADLTREYGFSVSQHEFDQALYKWFHAILLDQDTFSPEEKGDYANNPPIILLPSTLKANPACQNIPAVQKTPVSSLHSEQLIAHYIKLNGGLTEDIILGVSKLCCITCMDALQPERDGAPSFIVSGTHGETFSRTFNLRTQQAAPTTPKRPVPLTAEGSPGDTPGERKRPREPLSATRESSSPLARLTFLRSREPLASSHPRPTPPAQLTF